MRTGIEALLLAFMLLIITGCAAIHPPSVLDELQTQAQLKDPGIPTELTDLGILRFGEKVLGAWGLRSHGSEALNMGGALALAGLSTGTLAAAGSMSPGTTRGLAAGFNFILQALGIIKPAERNDARHEGAAMILEARGAFIEALAAKRVYHISNRRFTPQGALYFKQINAAIKIVDRLLVGLAPRIEDLEAIKPVPVEEQPDPAPDPQTGGPTLQGPQPAPTFPEVQPSS